MKWCELVRAAASFPHPVVLLLAFFSLVHCANFPLPDRNFFCAVWFLQYSVFFLPTCLSPSPPPSRPASSFVYCRSVFGAGQPADLLDSVASGSLPRESSGLFSEEPLVVAPEKRGGQVWRESKKRLTTTCHLSSVHPQSFTVLFFYIFLCKSCLVVALHLSASGVILFSCYFLWLSGTAWQETWRGRLRCGY